MAIDFNLPTASTVYTSVLTYIRDNIKAIAKMDFSGASNIANGTIRWNSSADQFEIYNSTAGTWSALSPSLSKVAGILAGSQALSGLNVTGSANIGSSTTRKLAPSGTFVNNTNGNPTISDVQLNIVSDVTEDAWKSIGPTGSGADVIWTALNAVPTDAVWIKISAWSYFVDSTAGRTAQLNCYSRKTGSSQTPGDPNRVITHYCADPTYSSSGYSNTFRVQVSTANLFDIYWAAINTTSRVMQCYLTGWGFNP